jgi:hypothetical protein
VAVAESLVLLTALDREGLEYRSSEGQQLCDSLWRSRPRHILSLGDKR